jgi:hypothetical protein
MRRYLYLGGQPSSGGGGGGGGAFAGPLHVDGLNFKAPDGSIVKVKGHTGFRSIEYFAKGEIGRLDDYFGAWAEQGANFNRDFCIWDNTGFNLARHPNGRDVLEGYLNYRKKWGYEHITFFCNQRQGGPNLLTQPEQDTYVDWASEIAVRVGNAIGEIENETLDADNGGNNGAFTRRFRPEQFHGLLMTRSTWDTGSGDNPDPQQPGSWMDWVCFHATRDNPEFAWESGKVGFEAQKGGLGPWPAAGRPAVDTEGIRIAEGTSPEDYADKVFHGHNLCAGSHVHGGFSSFDGNHQTDLQNCVFPKSGQPGFDHCQAVGRVWRSPLLIENAASDGRFVRAAVHDKFPFQQNDNECPIVHWDRFIDGDGHHYEDPRGAGRTYFMVMPDGRAIGGAAARAHAHQVEPRLNYSIVGQDAGSIVVAKR